MAERELDLKKTTKDNYRNFDSGKLSLQELGHHELFAFLSFIKQSLWSDKQQK
jgi:hypothetical protein